MQSQKLSQWMGVSGLLLLIALSRFILLPDLSFDQDEVWSVWQTFGSFEQILARTPFDWPAGYYLIVGFWRMLVGHVPFALRILPLFAFLIGISVTFQLGKKLFKSDRAGFLTMLAFAALGYVVYMSVLLRAYAVLMILMPLGLILVMRYFEKPVLARAAHLGILMAGMFYISLSVVFSFAVFGGFSLFLYGKKVWRWIFPGLIAFALAIPELYNKLQIVQRRVVRDGARDLPPLPDAVFGMFGEYFGPFSLIWFGITIVASIGLIYQGKRRLSTKHFWLMIWAVLGTCLMYWLDARTGFFRPRYGWWISWAIALWIGHGLSKLPRTFAYASGGLLICLMFLVPAQTVTDYKEPIGDFEGTFEWLSAHYAQGDVLVIDPNLQPWRLEVFQFYEDLYFPQGIQVVATPSDDYQRVWYLRVNSLEDEVTLQRVQEGRIAAEFTGQPGFFLQLYTAPPNPDGILFENGLRFHGYEVLNENAVEDSSIVRYEGDEIRLRLWWSIDEPLSQDYSVSIQVYDEEIWGIFAQVDTSPQPIFLQPNLTYTTPAGLMSTWETNTYYVEERVIELPYEPRLQRTEFTVLMAVYNWQDGVRFTSPDTNADDLLPLFDFTIMAW